MSDPYDLIEQAEELRRWAKRETEKATRSRLLHIADLYEHLAAMRMWSKLHPTSGASLSELFVEHS